MESYIELFLYGRNFSYLDHSPQCFNHSLKRRKPTEQNVTLMSLSIIRFNKLARPMIGPKLDLQLHFRKSGFRTPNGDLSARNFEAKGIPWFNRQFCTNSSPFIAHVVDEDGESGHMY